MQPLFSPFSIKDIQRLNPDVVVLATGSLPTIPKVDGIHSAMVVTFEHVLNEASPPFKQAVIIGGGATGLEVALYLTEYGCRVTVVEMRSEIGEGLETMTKKVLLGKLKGNGVKILTETKLERIESSGAVVSRDNGREILVEAERIILATGSRPCNHLYQKAKPLGYEIHQIGDCLEVRNAKAAIYEGAVLGRRI